MTTTISSNELRRKTTAAQTAARAGPVIITSRGRATHVLLSYEEYRRVTGRRNIVEALSMPGLADIELDD